MVDTAMLLDRAQQSDGNGVYAPQQGGNNRASSQSQASPEPAMPENEEELPF
jgi:hypothetical protein